VTSAMSNPPPVVCLDDWDKFQKLQQAVSLARRYGYVMALGPFAVAVFIALRFDFKGADMLIAASLAWAGVVIVCGLVVSGRALFIDCPSCGSHFGPGDACQWCDFPRHQPSHDSGVQI
jgi:hypothetical protein